MKRKPIKGKIPRKDWPAILSRHDRREPLAQIAADYGCTAPAISYIVRRARSEARAQQRHVTEGAQDTALPGKPVAMLRSGRSRGRSSAGADAGRSQAPISAQRQSWLDGELHQRISDDIASFVVALDNAVASCTDENLDLLLDASERLMRVAARTRIELARLRAATTGDAASPERDVTVEGDALRRRG